MAAARYPLVFALCTACGQLDTNATGQAITYGQLDGNAHPAVGAIVYHYVPDGNWYFYASSVLVAPGLVLTAGHCTQIFVDNPTLVDQVGIDFDPDVWATWDPSHVHLGHPHTHPEYRALGPPEAHYFNDYGVFVLDAPVSGLQPAALPTIGELDELNAQNGLRGTRFTGVGFGNTERILGPGGPTYAGAGVRRFALGTFRALDPDLIHISQNPASGDGGTCYGDSGGPNFIGNTNVVAGITSMGDITCQAIGLDPRTDLETLQSFLDTFL